MRYLLIAALLFVATPVWAQKSPAPSKCWPENDFATLNSANFAPNTIGWYVDGYRYFTIDWYIVQGTFTLSLETQLRNAPGFHNTGTYDESAGGQELSLIGPIGFIRLNMSVCGSSCIVKARVCGLP